MEDTNIEKLEKKSRRIKPLTLISGILGVLIGIALVALAVFVSYSMLSAFWIKDSSSAGEAIVFALYGWIIIPVLLIVGGLILVVAILNIVSGSLAISAATKDDKKYMARKGLIITSIVFDFILVLGLTVFAMSSTSGGSTASLFFTVGAISALVMAIIKIIDISVVSKRYNKQVAIEKANKKFEEAHGTESKLTKYKEMLDNGVVTQEEYEKLRAKELGLLDEKKE